MFGIFQLVSVFLVIINGVFCREMTSFLSLNAHRYKEALNSNLINSMDELISLSNNEEPIIVLRFLDFNIAEKLKEESDKKLPFLKSLFGSELTGILQENEDTEAINNRNILDVSSLPTAAYEYLTGKFSKEDDAVIVQFTDEEYDMEKLDEFLELLYVFMEDSVGNIDNMALQSPSFDYGFKDQELRDAASDETKLPDSDNDELSSLWTEGLLSCLLVSILLLAILGIAISWISSLEISYGALEKSTNPLKKTN